MKNKSTEKLMEMLCKELDEISGKGKLSAGDLDAVHKLIISKEKLLRCEELEETLGYSQEGGYSQNNYAMGNSYARGNSYANAGKHYVRPHYSRGGSRYSYDDGSVMLMENLQTIMDDPTITEMDRNALRRAMDVLSR